MPRLTKIYTRTGDAGQTSLSGGPVSYTHLDVYKRQGYVFGARFGFLLGAMTMLVSGIITAGVGPWLPYQMFTAGWVGLSAGLLPHLRRPRAELALLIVFAGLWGFAYGAILNLYTCLLYTSRCV